MSDWKIPRRYLKLMTPQTVIDVGVNRGTAPLYEAFPDAYYLLVEPIKENAKDIEALLTTIRGEHAMVAAGAAAGTAVLNVEKTRTGLSSFLTRTQLTATGKAIEEREVPVKPLDELIAGRDFPAPFGLKIDTEGFELDVVKGATETLTSCQFVITETSTAQRFENAYRSVDLIEYLRNRGFVIFDIMKTTRRYADLLFMRP